MMKAPPVGNTLLLHYLAMMMLIAAFMAGCATSPSDGAAPPTPIPTPLPFDQAVLKAANELFSKAQLPTATSDSSTKHILVIDPLVDGVTGAQSTATRSMESRIVELVRTQYPQFEVRPFSSANVVKSPIVFIGTHTGVNDYGKTTGERTAFRICLALLDLKSGKLISWARSFAKTEGVDITPTPYFRDNPAWTSDAATEGYIKSCQGVKAGDPINPLYLDHIMAATLINDAMVAYNSGQYQQALDLYKIALQTPGGDQLRVYNGLYQTYWKLGRRNEATQAFARIVDYGLTNKQLAIKFLFKPGAASFGPDPQIPVWLKQIAQRTARSERCLEIVGHTSASGPEPLNERLSLLRALYVKQRLDNEAPLLNTRTIAHGVGSTDPRVLGPVTDDARDAPNRRVDFKVIECSKS